MVLRIEPRAFVWGSPASFIYLFLCNFKADLAEFPRVSSNLHSFSLSLPEGWDRGPAPSPLAAAAPCWLMVVTSVKPLSSFCVYFSGLQKMILRLLLGNVKVRVSKIFQKRKFYISNALQYLLNWNKY